MYSQKSTTFLSRPITKKERIANVGSTIAIRSFYLMAVLGIKIT